MKRTILTAVVAALVTLGVALTAAAQTDLLSGLLGPVLVTIEQAVPVEITLATALDDGTVITSTVPLTVGVSLAVTIDGDQVVTVAPADAGEAQVAVESIPAGEELVDNMGLPYTLEIADHLELIQVQTGEDTFERLSMIGEIGNLDDDPVERVKITITLYGVDGEMLAVTNGYLANNEIAPGESGPFTTMIIADAADVASYRLQIE